MTAHRVADDVTTDRFSDAPSERRVDPWTGLPAGGEGDVAPFEPTVGTVEDSVVAEVRMARDALFAAAGYDVDELFRQVAARQELRRQAQGPARGEPAPGPATQVA